MEEQPDSIYDNLNYLPALRTFRVWIQSGNSEPWNILVTAHSYTCDADVAAFYTYSTVDVDGVRHRVLFSNRTLKNWADVEDITDVVGNGSNAIN
jgi:hypothetical protein